MKYHVIYSFLLSLIFNCSIGSIPSDFIFKKSKDGSKIYLDQLIKEKYVVQIGDEFEIAAHVIFDSPNYEEALKSIFDLGINVDVEVFYEDGKCFTLLHKAISAKKEKIALFLIQNGADVNAIDWDGFSPLVYAVKSRFKEGVNLLIKHGASIDIKYDYGMSILDFAILDCPVNDVEMLELLIEHGANFKERNIYGNRALFFAVGESNEPAVKVLLEHGVNLSMEIESFNWAICQANKSMVELFINNGIDINSKDRDRKTPLAIAVGMLDSWHCSQLGQEYKKENRGRIIEIVELLLKNGANPNDDFYLDRPIWLISEEIDEKVYNMLKRYGADTWQYYKKILGPIIES